MAQNRFRLLSDFLLIFNLFFLSNAPAFVFVFWLSSGYVLFEFLLWSLLGMITVLKMKKENLLANFFDTLKRNWIIFPFVTFSGISILWSVYWEISLYRWSILLFTIITGGYIGLKYDLKKIIEFLSVFGIYILLFALAIVVFIPDVGVMHFYIIQGAWKGIYWQKNHMGLVATFINILFLINVIYSLQSRNQKKSYVWVFLYLFSWLFIIQSDSAASYLTMIFLYGLIVLTLLLLKFGNKLSRSHYLSFLIVLVFVSILIFGNLEFIFGIFNRNTTLTGRVPMWAFLFDSYISKRPFGGYGFNAFWYLESHQKAVQQAAGYPHPIIIADNGFIDVLVNTGYVGLVLFLIFYFGVWWRSITYALKSKDIIGVFPLILMAFTLLANISWSLIFENEGFFMLIMIAILFFITSKNSINNPTYQ